MLRKILLVAVVFTLVSLGVITVMAQARPDTTGEQNLEIQQQIDVLHQQLKEAIEKELENGTWEIGLEGERVFTGESLAKMAELTEKTRVQIDILIARPEGERALAGKTISKINGETPTYLQTTSLPYSGAILAEIYKTDTRTYAIDARNDNIVQIDVPAQIALDFDYTKRFSVTELEKMAVEFIHKIATDVDLSTLTPRHNNKDGMVYFFRWEDKSAKLEDGASPFVQVGISAGGDVGTYVNTLQLGLSKTAPLSGNVTLANDGNYYSKGGSRYTKLNAGYCYIYGWCNPKHFRYKQEQSGVGYWGRWDYTNYWQYSNVWAFIPGTKATTGAADYHISYYYGTHHEWVPQIWSNDSYKLLTPLGAVYRVYHTYLDNVPGTGGVHSDKYIAFDEIYISYH